MVIEANDMDKSDWIAVGVAVGIALFIIFGLSVFPNLIGNYSDKIVIECYYWKEDVMGPPDILVGSFSSLVYFQVSATNIGDQSLFVSIDILLFTSLGQSYEEHHDFGLIEPEERHGFSLFWPVPGKASDYTLEYEVEVTARAS